MVLGLPTIGLHGLTGRSRMSLGERLVRSMEDLIADDPVISRTGAYLSPTTGKVIGTNLVPTDPDDWTTIGVNTTVTDLGDGSWRIQMPNMSQTFVRQTLSAMTGKHTVGFEWRNTPGSTETGTFKVESQTVASVDLETYLPDTAPPSEWTSVIVTKTEGGTGIFLTLSDTGGCDIQVRPLGGGSSDGVFLFSNTASVLGNCPAGSPADYVMPDIVQSGGARWLATYGGWTNKVADDVTQWTISDGSRASVTDNEDGTYTVTFNGNGAVSVTAGYSLSSGNTAVIKASLISGSPGAPIGDYIALRDGSFTAVDTLVNLEDLTDTPTLYTAYDNVTQTVELAIRSAGASAFSILVSAPRVAEIDVLVPASPPGSAAGHTVNETIPTGTPTWPTAGVLATSMVPYGWTGPTSPVSEAPRFFDMQSPTWLCYVKNTTDIETQNGAGATAVAGTVTEDETTTTFNDWDGVDTGFAVDDGARIAKTNTQTPSVNISYGNRASGGRVAHGLVACLAGSSVFNQKERTAVAAHLASKAPAFKY